MYILVRTMAHPKTPSPDEVTPQPGSLIPSGIHRSSVDDDGLAMNRELSAWQLPAARPSPHNTNNTQTHTLTSSHPAFFSTPPLASRRTASEARWKKKKKRPCVAQAVSEATKKETHWPQRASHPIGFFGCPPTSPLSPRQTGSRCGERERKRERLLLFSYRGVYATYGVLVDAYD